MSLGTPKYLKARMGLDSIEVLWLWHLALTKFCKFILVYNCAEKVKQEINPGVLFIVKPDWTR